MALLVLAHEEEVVQKAFNDIFNVLNSHVNDGSKYIAYQPAQTRMIEARGWVQSLFMDLKMAQEKIEVHNKVKKEVEGKIITMPEANNG